MPNKKVPYFAGLENYLIAIRDEFAALGKKKDADELDFPPDMPVDEKTPYGTRFRHNPKTYSQYMAIYTEKLDVVIDNLSVLKNRAEKEELEKEIAETDDYYRGSIDRINEEIAAARRTEEEMRKRYLSAYEMNAPYVEELKQKKLDSKEEINMYIPIDEFKAAWEDASKKLCKLLNAKVETEKSYEVKTEQLLTRYKENERRIKAGSASLANADAAWNSIFDGIEVLENNNAIRALNEKQLNTSPEKGEMSNYEKWRLQTDLTTLKTALTGLEQNVNYNEQFKNVENINNKFDRLERFVADEFDSEYADVELEGENGIYAQLNTDEMKEAAAFKNQISTEVNKVRGQDPQGAVDNDDYGTLLRTMKEDTTTLDRLESEKEQINKTIAEHMQKLAGLEIESSEQQAKLDNWKDPEPIPHLDDEMAEAEEEIQEAQRAIARHNNVIAKKQEEIAQQEKVVNEVIPTDMSNLQKNIDAEADELYKAQAELADLDRQLADLDNEYGKAPADAEFKDEELDKWEEEYIRLSPNDPAAEIRDLFSEGFVQAQSIGIQIANDRYNLQKAEERFYALDKFREAGSNDGIRTAAQYREEYKNNTDRENENYSREKSEINEKYDVQIESLKAELNSVMASGPDETMFERIELPDISADLFDVEDEDDTESEEYEEFLAEKELFDDHFDEWRDLLHNQENAILAYAKQIDEKNLEAEQRYNEIVRDAEETLNRQEAEITELHELKASEIKSEVLPEDREQFNNAVSMKNSLLSELNSKREAFLEEQEAQVGEYEREIEERLAEMDESHERNLSEKEDEYRRLLENTEFEYMIKELESSAIPQYYDQLGVAQAQRDYWNSKIVSHELTGPAQDVQRQLNEEYKSKVEALDKEIETIRKNIHEEAEAKQINMQQADRQHIGSQIMIKSQLDYLREQQANERERYEKELRSGFEKNRADALKKFELGQQKQIDEFDNANFSGYRLQIAKNLEELQRETDGKLAIAEKAYAEAKDKAHTERNNVRRQLSEHDPERIADVAKELESNIAEFNTIDNYIKYKQSQKNEARPSIGTLEDLLIGQQLARREFFEKNKLNTGEHSTIRKEMELYQRRRSAEILGFVKSGRVSGQDVREKYLGQIERLEQKRKKDLDVLEKEHSEALKNIEIGGEIDTQHEMSALFTRAQNDLSFNLGKLDRLNAEKISIPNEIKLTQLNLRDAQAELDRVVKDNNRQIESGQKDYQGDRAIITEYKEKYSKRGFDDVIETIEKWRAAVRLGELLSKDLENFKNQVFKDSPDTPVPYMDAYREGEAYYRMINEHAEEDVRNQERSGKTFESDAKRAQAMEDAFYKYEHDFLFEATVEQKAKYDFYACIDQHKKAFFDVMAFKPEEIKQFNEKVMDSVQKAAGIAIDSDVRFNPKKFLEEIKNNAELNLKASVDRLRNRVTAEYEAREKEAFNAKKKVFDDNLKKQISKIQNEIAVIKDDNRNAERINKAIADQSMGFNAAFQTLSERINYIKERIKSIEGMPKQDSSAKEELKSQRNILKVLNANMKEMRSNLGVNNEATRNNVELIKKNEALIAKKEEQIKKLSEQEYRPEQTKTQAQRDKEITEQGLPIMKELNNKKVLHAIDRVFEFNHTNAPIRHRMAATIAFHERKVGIFKKELEVLEKSRITNEEEILKCNENVAKNMADVAKYQMYEKGFGRDYDDAKRKLEQAGTRLKNGEEALQKHNEKQLQLQNELKEKIKVSEKDPLAQKENLLKKNRLIDSVISRYTKELEADNKRMDELKNEESALLEGYLSIDSSSTQLDELTAVIERETAKNGISAKDVLDRETKRLEESRRENIRKQKENIDALGKIRIRIDDLGAVQYNNEAERRNALDAIRQQNDELHRCYAQKRALDEEALNFTRIEKALAVIGSRQRQAELRETISRKEALLSPARSAKQMIERDINLVREELKKRHSIKSEQVQSMTKAAAGFKQSIEQGLQRTEVEKNKLENMKRELDELQHGEKKQLLDSNLKNAQNQKQQVVLKNEEIDKKNKENKEIEGIGGQKYKLTQQALQKTKEEIADTNELLNQDRSDLEQKNKEIEAEKVNMRLKLLAERKQLGNNMLKLDKFNRLNRQRGKLEDFQNRHLRPMVGEYRSAEQIVAQAEESLAGVNAEMKQKMAQIEAMSATVKKWYYSDSKEFKNMIEAVHKCANLADNTNPAAAIAALAEAAAKAGKYIEERETDWVKTGSLLRKSRLALAKDIIRTGRILSSGYLKFQQDKEANMQKFGKYNSNREKMNDLRSSENVNTGTYGKFCELYVKPISTSTDEKYIDHRMRDERFDTYTSNIYTKEWDKIERELDSNYKENLEQVKTGKNDKLTWGPDTYVGRNLKSMYDRGFKESKKIMIADQNNDGLFPDLMIEEIYQKGLDHVIKNNADSEVVSYKYEIDKTDYSKINATEQKLAFDKALAEEPEKIKIEVIPKNADQSEKKLSFNDEFKGIKKEGGNEPERPNNEKKKEHGIDDPTIVNPM